jgi:hypothetical protein
MRERLVNGYNVIVRRNKFWCFIHSRVTMVNNDVLKVQEEGFEYSNHKEFVNV